MNNYPLKLLFDLLNWVAFWANYKIQFNGPEAFTLPLGIIAMMGASLFLLVFYSVKQFKEHNQ